MKLTDCLPGRLLIRLIGRAMGRSPLVEPSVLASSARAKLIRVNIAINRQMISAGCKYCRGQHIDVVAGSPSSPQLPLRSLPQSASTRSWCGMAGSTHRAVSPVKTHDRWTTFRGGNGLERVEAVRRCHQVVAQCPRRNRDGNFNVVVGLRSLPECAAMTAVCWSSSAVRRGKTLVHPVAGWLAGLIRSKVAICHIQKGRRRCQLVVAKVANAMTQWAGRNTHCFLVVLTQYSSVL